MILQKTLKEPPATAAAAAAASAMGFGSSSATILGIKVIGGKLINNRTGAVIEKVKKGAIADTVGKLLPGDEVLEWNGHSFVDRTYEEVHAIISESRHEPQVELRVSRHLVGPAAAATAVQQQQQQQRASSSRPAVTISDPHGGTHMLNPNAPGGASTGVASSAVVPGIMGTRIQVRRSDLLNQSYFV